MAAILPGLTSCYEAELLHYGDNYNEQGGPEEEQKNEEDSPPIAAFDAERVLQIKKVTVLEAKQ